jgi:hypothetical protein
MTERYERELERVQRARAEFEASQDEVERRKQDYFTSVQTLHEAGMALREIASALGLSHQRVHQMVEEATGKKHGALRRRVGRATKQGGLALLLVVLVAWGVSNLQLDRSRKDDPGGTPGVAMAPSPTKSLGETHQELRNEMIEFSCAQQIFEWHDAAKEAFGKGAAVIIKPMCELGMPGPREAHSTDLEAEVKRRLHDIVVTIREQA